MPEFDRDLAIKVRETIRAKPELHDQKVWGHKLSCGTAHCIAGWVCSLSGIKFSWSSSLSGNTVEFTADQREIPVVARELLGLDEDQESALFYEYDNGAALHMLDILIRENGSIDWAALLAEADEYKRTPHA